MVVECRLTDDTLLKYVGGVLTLRDVATKESYFIYLNLTIQNDIIQTASDATTTFSCN